jgi:hypothetical protein
MLPAQAAWSAQGATTNMFWTMVNNISISKDIKRCFFKQICAQLERGGSVGV